MCGVLLYGQIKVKSALPTVEPTDSYVEAWARAFEVSGTANGRLGNLTGALDSMGDKGLRLVLKRLKIETAADLVKRCASE